jgi:hypothetical protein
VTIYPGPVYPICVSIYTIQARRRRMTIDSRNKIVGRDSTTLSWLALRSSIAIIASPSTRVDSQRRGLGNWLWGKHCGMARA